MKSDRTRVIIWLVCCACYRLERKHNVVCAAAASCRYTCVYSQLKFCQIGNNERHCHRRVAHIFTTISIDYRFSNNSRMISLENSNFKRKNVFHAKKREMRIYDVSFMVCTSYSMNISESTRKGKKFSYSYLSPPFSTSCFYGTT